MNKGFRALSSAQFLGAFNDHTFKNAWVIGLTVNQAGLSKVELDQLVALSAGVFVLPFVLFSALAGQLSDKYPKHRLLRATKLLEIFAMLVGAAGLCSGSLLVSLLGLFVMGTQAAAFGPLKYGALPELVGVDKLLPANARVESGTFLAILLGALAGSALGQHTAALTSGVLIVVSVVGYCAARCVPALPAAAPELGIEYGLLRPTWRLLKLVRSDRASWLATLGISWFWLIGSAVLSTLPRLVSLTGVAPGSLLAALLVVFTLGVAAGSLLCERFSRGRLELGLVPLGALGVSVFLADAAFSCLRLTAQPEQMLWSWLHSVEGLHLSLDLFLLALASSLFTVPLYTLLQLRTPEAARARAISANNVVNAAFMVLGSVVLMSLSALGASVTQVFAYFALLNLCVAAFAYVAEPRSCLRVLCWVLGHLGYRLQIQGREHLPQTGAAVLVANHVSYVDWMLIAAASPRPVRFVMHRKFLELPATGRVFRDAGVIPISGQREDAATLNAAFDAISAALRAGELVCVFPEGQLSRDGELQEFRRGIERIVARDPVPVVPMHLAGLWGSCFSHSAKRPLTRVRARVTLRVAPALRACEVTAERLFAIVRGLTPS